MAKTVYLSDFKELEGKQFESMGELEAAEAKVSEENKKRQELTDAKKVMADKVKAAITERIETEAKAKKVKTDAYKAYLKALDTENAKINEKKKAENEALREFCKKYGYYHDTIKIGDVSYDYRYSDSSDYSPISLLDVFNNIWTNF